MEKSGISPQSNQKSQANENCQKQNSSAASSFQTSSDHQTSKSSFLQKWFGGQTGQDRDKQISGQQKSEGMSWGEDVHYII